MGVKQQFRVFAAADGSPLSGLSLTFSEFIRRAAGVDTSLLSSPPTIAELLPLSPGTYEFETLDGQALIGTTLRWLVTLGPLATSLYEYGLIDGNESVSSSSVDLADNALTTLERVKAELSITDTDSDSTLVFRINAASDMIEKYCSRKFNRETGIEERVKGYGSELIHVDRTPVEEIEAVSLDDGDTELAASEYRLASAEKGSIFAVQTSWPWTAASELSASPHRRAGFEADSILVTYTAGYALPQDNRTPGDFPLPYDLELACVQLTTHLFRTQGKSLALQQKQVGNASESYAGGVSGLPAIPGPIAMVLDTYRRVW